LEQNESIFKEAFRAEILTILLDKYERSRAYLDGEPGKQRPQISLHKAPFNCDYNDEMDFRKRLWMNESLIELVGQGAIELTWERFREQEVVRTVYLRVENVEVAYAVSGVVPLTEKLERLRATLAPLSDHPWEWVRRWVAKKEESLAERKTASLDVDDAEGYADLALVLNELPALEGEQMALRVFSQRLFRDTKHLERRVLKRLIGLVKKASGEYRDTEEEWLDYLGIVRNPQHAWVCGSLLLYLADGRVIDTSLFPGGLGLSGTTIRAIERVTTTARRALTIENLTSYHQWIDVHAADAAKEVVIYTGGYPHRVLQELLGKLAEGMDLVTEVYHWGDIDLGGIRIFEYMKRHFFPALRPYRMDVDTLLAYEAVAGPVVDEYAEQLRVAAQDPQYAEWVPVLNAMLARGIRLEQESV
jgi:hypothetical protein